MPKNDAAPKCAPEDSRQRPPGKRVSILRLLPLLLIVAGLVAFFAEGLDRYLSFEQLAMHRQALGDWVADYGILSALIVGAAYAVMVACSVPGGALATIVVGFLFGLWVGTVTVVIGATAGAVALFLAVRFGLGDALRARAGPAVKKMERGFQENAFNYLLVLRLVPLFPFFVVNIVPAFLGVRLRTYFLATFFGIIPGTFVYTSVGNGLGAVLDAGGTPDLGMIFNWEILLPIIGLALLALIPVIYKKVKARTAGHGKGD